MGTLSTMFYAGILTPTICTVIIFIIFLICWFKCNLREKVNEMLDSRKKKTKQSGTVVANAAHFQNYKTSQTRRDTESVEGSECDSAFDSLHDMSTEEWNGSRSGSNARNSPAMEQTQSQPAMVGPVVNLLWEVNETSDSRPCYADYMRTDYMRTKTPRTVSSDTIKNNLDQKRLSKIPSKDLVTSLGETNGHGAVNGGCHPVAGAYMVESPVDNTIVGLAVLDPSQYCDTSKTSAAIQKEQNSRRNCEYRPSNDRNHSYQHRTARTDYLAARADYLAAMNLDSTII